ncbi:hypothetical protein [Streptomyces venezuelae]|uniref:hypothetical protein n=1 Tax=Streptomyces venezuelae TaxID=54571 RepID=UPI001F40CCFD|nr:hypothetical protein [Streptomyces venezuelae]
MRPLATRRITALAISAAITLGTAGPAFADEHRPSTAAARAARAPLPNAAALLSQTEALGELGSVITPVTDLLTATLKADSGQLPAADAEALKAKIAAAVDQAKAAAPADVVTDALATVEKAVAGLLAAVTSGDAGGVVPQVTATLTSLVNLAVATVLGSGLPAPDLAGLPQLPSLPVAVPELPVDPPALPVDPPVAAPELPVKPPVSLP